jgi:hypothetical protein
MIIRKHQVSQNVACGEDKDPFSNFINQYGMKLRPVFHSSLQKCRAIHGDNFQVVYGANIAQVNRKNVYGIMVMFVR